MIQFAPRRLTRVALLLVLLATSCSLRTSVTSTPTPVSQPPAATPDTSLADQQRFPDVLKVELTRKDDGRFDVAVTMSSPYDTPQRYADGWRVLTPDGQVLGTHTLAHDHASEQPFTRTQSGVVIPSEVLQVTVEGRDKTYGFGGKTVTSTVPTPGNSLVSIRCARPAPAAIATGWRE